jgi:hypothetical protein
MVAVYPRFELQERQRMIIPSATDPPWATASSWCRVRSTVADLGKPGATASRYGELEKLTRKPDSDRDDQ